MLTTTLIKIFARGQQNIKWDALLAHLGKTQMDNDPLPFATIIDACGLVDAVWCMRTAPEHSDTWREFALFCAPASNSLLRHRAMNLTPYVAAWNVSREAARVAAGDDRKMDRMSLSEIWEEAQKTTWADATDKVRDARRTPEARAKFAAEIKKQEQKLRQLVS